MVMLLAGAGVLAGLALVTFRSQPTVTGGGPRPADALAATPRADVAIDRAPRLPDTALPPLDQAGQQVRKRPPRKARRPRAVPAEHKRVKKTPGAEDEFIKVPGGL
jgi:hypothetical protein